jgi:drug/metabolite transporter (DMT)-like permease
MAALPDRIRSLDSVTPRHKTYALLALIILAWGSNYPLMKMAIGDMPPLAFTAVRLTGAACALAIILVLLRAQSLLPAPGERMPLAIAGLFQIAAMLGLTIIGLTTVEPGRAVLLVYTMQLWAVPLGAWLLKEKPSPGMLTGSAIGFLGILIFFNPASANWHDLGTLVGNGLILLAAVSWALGSCLYRKRAWKSSFMVQTLWQMGISAVPIAALSLVFERGAILHFTSRLAAIIVFNWLVPTALALWCWSKILSAMPVSVAGQWLLLTPIVGFALSALFLNEAVTPTLLISAALIATGIFLTMRSETVACKDL